MIDSNGRNIDYVRISITDRCNLRCIYCMPKEGIKQVSHERILTYDEIERVCRELALLGIKKIKLTGGEPLVRKDCASLASRLKRIPGIESVTLTTNGILLREQLPGLVEAGIDSINISLDTLDQEKFREITNRDGLSQVMEGIYSALEYPQLSLKINCVPIGTDKENYVELAGIAKNQPIHVRFIEMMPIGYGKRFMYKDETSIQSILEEEFGPMRPLEEAYGNGPCRYYELEGFKGKIGFISAMSHKFCERCNRVRLTSEGLLKGCLQYQNGRDLRTLLRNGSTEEQLREAIRNVIYEKPMEHHFHERTHQRWDETRAMAQIGG